MSENRRETSQLKAFQKHHAKIEPMARNMIEQKEFQPDSDRVDVVSALCYKRPAYALLIRPNGYVAWVVRSDDKAEESMKALRVPVGKDGSSGSPHSEPERAISKGHCCLEMASKPPQGARHATDIASAPPWKEVKGSGELTTEAYRRAIRVSFWQALTR